MRQRLESRSVFPACIILLCSLFLAACGGGGGSGGGASVSFEITSFTASTNAVPPGENVAITAVFSGGTGNIDKGVGAVESNQSKTVSPTSSTTYTLTVTNGSGESITRTLVVTVDPINPIIIQVVSPGQNLPTGNDMKVLVTVQSEFEIASVTAAVGDLSTPLSPTTELICTSTVCPPAYTGVLSLASLVPGQYVMTVTADDVVGGSGSVERGITLDNSAVLTVAAPLPYSVARPSLPVNVGCNDAQGDCLITVYAGRKEIASAVNQLTDVLDLSAYDGLELDLIIRGTDSAEQVTSVSIPIYVETSASLLDIKDFPGPIVDFDSERALVIASDLDADHLAILGVTSDMATQIELPAGFSVTVNDDIASIPATGLLTPPGAIFVAYQQDDFVPPSHLYDWNGTSLSEIQSSILPQTLQGSGDYAIWVAGQALWLRQLSTTTDTQISASNAATGSAVGSNGVVAYSTSPDFPLERYEDGIATTLVQGGQFWNLDVVSDGMGFVYAKREMCCDAAIAYNDGENELVLTDFRSGARVPGRDYQINNGWVAYTELGNQQQTHVWTRAADGTLLQRTFYSTNATIEYLAPDGEVMVQHAQRRYLSDTDGQLTEISSALGTARKIGDIWYVSIGRSLFRLLE